MGESKFSAVFSKGTNPIMRSLSLGLLKGLSANVILLGLRVPKK